MPSTFARPINDFSTTLAAAHAIGDGVLVLAAGAGTTLGTLGANRVWRVTALSHPDTPAEEVLGIFEVTGRTGDTLTGVTAVEGYADAALAAGRTVQVRMTAKDLSELQDAVNANETAIALRAIDTAVVHTAGDETIAGQKAFLSTIIGDISGNAATATTADSATTAGTITGSIAESQVTDLTTNLAAKADDSTVAHKSANESISGAWTFGADIAIDASASTQAAVRQLAFNGGASTEFANRLAMAGSAYYVQAGFGTRFQIGAYWGLVLSGNRQADAPAFASGGPSDPSVTVVGTTAAATVFRAQVASGQTGPAIEVMAADGTTVLASFDPAGNLSAPVLATGTTTARNLTDRHAESIHCKDFGATGDGTTDDTTALQAWLDACALAGARGVFDRPTDSYKVTDTLTIYPPAAGAQVHMDLIGVAAYPGLIRWAGGDNKPVFRVIGLKLSTLKNINIQIPANATGVTAWELENTVAAPSISDLIYENCRVDFGTGATNCNGWRMGHGSDGTGQDISFLTFLNCSTNGVETGGGNRGWSSEHQNVLIINLVDCDAQHIDRFVSNVPTAGAVSAYGGSSINTFGGGTSHCLIDHEYTTAGAYLISGGRYEVGGTSFLSVPNAGANPALAITVSGTEIDGYDGKNVFDLRSSVSLKLDGVSIAPDAALHGSGMIRLDTTAGVVGSVLIDGCAFGATDPFHTVVSGDWLIRRDGVILEDLTGGSTGRIDDTTTDLAAKADDSAVVHTTGAETIAGHKSFTGKVTITSDGTNNIQEWLDSSSLLASGVDPAGRIFAGGQPHSAISTNIKILASDASDAYFGAAVGAKICFLEYYDGADTGIVDVYDYGNNVGKPLMLGGNATLVSLKAPNAAPTDAQLQPGQITAYLDEAGATLHFRVRYSGGTYKTASLALT